MLMEVKDSEVVVAHRLGQKMVGRLRSMVIRCNFSLHDRVFHFVKNLKDKKNDEGQYYYVRQQLPEPMLTQRKERNERITQIKKNQ